MNLDQEIYKVLLAAGQKGLSVRKLSLHVYNASNGLFSQIDFNDIHKYVGNFLRRVSQRPGSLVERADRRGYYRIRKGGGQSLFDAF